MKKNEEETRFYLIDPILREKGYRWPYLKMERPAPVEPIGPKGRRRPGPGKVDYLICIEDPKGAAPLPVGILEAKKEDDDPLKGMQQAKGYMDCKAFETKYIFSTNGHLYAKFNKFTGEQTGPFPLADFPDHKRITDCYAKHTGITLGEPATQILFMADSPAYPESRYYQDAAIRAAFEKIILEEKAGNAPRVLLSLATGAGKTIIAANLLWRLHEAERLPKPALFLCDRDELREQAYNKLKAVFGDNARIVKIEHGENAAKNARIHITTYQTLGLDDEDEEFASFLSENYPEDSFSVIIIDECHRSAWGKWSEVLKRNPNAIHIGLTATPRQLRDPKKKELENQEDSEITANNHQYFGEPVYEYTLIQAQDDGYLAACEILKRKATIDSRIFTKAEILAAKPTDLKTGLPVKEDDLTKSKYTGKDFDNEVFIDMRTPAMCQDLFKLLCENGGPEQKVIIFCTREYHADRVAIQMNNLYVHWCKENKKEPKEHYAFKCMGGSNNGSDMIEPMRGSGERAFIACTVDLLESGVDIERLNAVVFFRYLKSAIKFYQMVGRGTRIHEATEKYKFWLYDYTGTTNLFGTDFITEPPRPGGGGRGGGGGGGDGDDDESPSVPQIAGQTDVLGDGRYILGQRNGQDVSIPVDEYRQEMIQRVLSEASNLDEFRQIWVESQRRKQFIKHLRGSHYNPELIRNFDKMTEYDNYDILVYHSYHARALKKKDRGILYVNNNADWFKTMNPKAAAVLKALGQQFSIGGTEALESQSLWQVPDIADQDGLYALENIGKPSEVMIQAKERLFAE